MVRDIMRQVILLAYLKIVIDENLFHIPIISIPANRMNAGIFLLDSLTIVR